MFTLEERKKAVLQLIEFDMPYAITIRKLGYPNDWRTLKKWYIEYKDTGELHSVSIRKPKYTYEQKKYAVDYYISHGKNLDKTIKNIGYPCRTILNTWIQEIAPHEKRHCSSGGHALYSTREKREAAVIALCTRDGSANQVAQNFNVSRVGLYSWKRQLLGEGSTLSMEQNKSIQNVFDTAEEVNNLKEQVHKLKLERDILEHSIEI